MKKTFLQVCKKHPEDVLKPNLNNCLKIGSFIMLFIHLLQGFTILGYKVDEILSDNENWHCNIWPRDSDLPCLSKKKYALAFIRLILNTHLIVLLAVGMITRKSMLMVPWLIFRFIDMMVSLSIK